MIYIFIVLLTLFFVIETDFGKIFGIWLPLIRAIYTIIAIANIVISAGYASLMGYYRATLSKHI